MFSLLSAPLYSIFPVAIPRTSANGDRNAEIDSGLDERREKGGKDSAKWNVGECIWNRNFHIGSLKMMLLKKDKFSSISIFYFLQIVAQSSGLYGGEKEE